jgi:hypothetical protein
MRREQDFIEAIHGHGSNIPEYRKAGLRDG